MIIRANNTVLFQGDSVTDAWRDREDLCANTGNALGLGYVHFTGAALLAQYASLGLKVYNRDIVGALDERWQSDCLALKPDVLSVLIGINDTARSVLKSPIADTPEGFDRTYRKILDAARQKYPDLCLVICEPFALTIDYVTSDWIPGLHARQAFSKQIATDYDAVWVPFQQLFDDAEKSAPAEYWLTDGVHPTSAGHHLMIQMWLNKVHSANCCS